MVCRVMRQLLVVYKYNIKRSCIYSMYKMCTDNNKIRLLQHERASNSQSPDTLSDQRASGCLAWKPHSSLIHLSRQLNTLPHSVNTLSTK